jgi:hypothetical protein
MYRSFILIVWGLLVAGGFWGLFIYANTPGVAAVAPPHWPSNSALSRDAKLPTLVLFAHPRCPCSEATIGELERLMPHIYGKFKTDVVFFQPSGKSDAWVKQDLWKKTQAIPGVDLVLDVGGAEASRFDAKTSGQTFLYDADGNLVFSGGLTPSRGHMGDSLGRDAILSFAERRRVAIQKTSVFGCSLRNPERAPAGELQ